MKVIISTLLALSILPSVHAQTAQGPVRSAAGPPPMEQLMQAALEGRTDAASAAINAGADPKTADPDGRTALYRPDSRDRTT